jgi:hemoglobin
MYRKYILWNCLRGTAIVPLPAIDLLRGGVMSVVAAPRLSHVTDGSIALLVERFYAAVRRHAVLAPVFDTAIAPDEWPTHLATMRRFWSSVMQASGAYSGNPVAVHRAVPGLERMMFAQWLALFEATVTVLFTPELAAAFVVKARRIAMSLELAVFHRLGAPPDGLGLPAEIASRTAATTVPCD